MDTSMQYAWLVPLFPLIAFAIILSFGRQLKEGAGYISILLTAASLVLACITFMARFQEGAQDYVLSIKWLQVGDYVIPVGFEVNQLNAMMLVIVSIVSLLVQIYSRGYMQGDQRFPVFYQYLALFTFSMLGLVISPNLLQLYIFWELVGVCSFLLVGYYYFKPEAKAAAKKAFIVTRIGDVGLFIAICLLFWQTGRFEFDDIFTAIQGGKVEPFIITLAAILIFVGAAGKSGQFPLHTWLPDAMEGPTPVSALIHAATMVAAGVYLVATTFPLFIESPIALDVVAYVGGFTAIFAASIGLTQRDIKRVLAYSTVSQLGFMMMALGVAGAAGYVAGTFHLMTHAFFKALLFLAAGSVIHAAHTQDVFKMGGLSKRMPVTSVVFLIGCLAIAGIPPFSGFWSKEEILGAVYAAGRYDLLVIAIVAAFFTAFYMFRLYFLTFRGTPASEGAKKAYESPSVMTIPMLLLALLAIGAGFINLPNAPVLGEWLMSGSVGQFIIDKYGEEAGHGALWLQIVAVIISLFGIGLAYLIYGKKNLPNDIISEQLPWLYQLSYRKFYMDEIYTFVFIRPLKGIGLAFNWLDYYIIDGLVRSIGGLTNMVGRLLSRLQSGQMQTYGFVVLLGLVVLMVSLTALGGVPFVK
ncbi:NADH-quinone oxidoreductase subunit L [Brevibacillus laterosporus]|uniref:NADH-quinone oxidoreductase subunit L n=1 Tax=Brevibacillus laterosporus TaxID=1465 RepID=UPI00038026C1|nr:NADH-quinone oxidoreductase subunit L [Brevibacillus laterosporus]ATO49163.1 NADH-quinone oxidoreductase subunit L [Brevibacillus laterosporus DSM 25]MBG9803590.1 NADH:ubiquinone oxidoreductase subunit L [Brevibacillus laterosporus]MED2003538.1 NADH-quinone oxidoreductase subunit L [Brevibacillus laterosporus]MED4763154.1 NADH-quinone oxidoreductase subunit L [Brevibacillus laterosporus]TPH19820.1 NADH-quinone oxidoreductase subunit L [Brevibacillus laterosporus]